MVDQNCKKVCQVLIEESFVLQGHIEWEHRIENYRQKKYETVNMEMKHSRLDVLEINEPQWANHINEATQVDHNWLYQIIL